MKQRALAWLILAVGMIWCRAAYIEDVVLNIDEAEYAVAADALDRGWLPGVDLLGSTKPPGIVFLYKLLFLTFGRSIAVIHAAHIVLLVAAGMLLVELAIALWNRSAAVPAALLFWMTANSYSTPPEIAALNVESPGILLAAASLLLTWKKPQSPLALLAAGTCLGLAVMFRQSFAVFLLPVVVALLVLRARRWSVWMSLAAGIALPWIPIFAVYAATGGLAWAWDSWVRYPFTYAGDPGLRGFFIGAYYSATDFWTQAFIPCAMAVGGIVLLWRERQNVRTLFLASLGFTSLIALCAGSRFFGHYWIQLFPAVALLGVPSWLALARGARRMRWLLAAAVMIGSAVAAIHYPTWHWWDPSAPRRGISYYSLGTNAAELPIADFVKKNTTPDETIAVWGYAPQIYYFAHRLPAVRDYMCHYITGFSAGTFEPTVERAVRAQSHPQAEQMFIADLERRRPKYVFDLWLIDNYAFTFMHYAVTSYPELAAYLRANYRPDREISMALVYRRLTPADSEQTMPDTLKP
jgi:4-amino-4-deoxy-L-arabinose transferase-like glycosyltransferase